MSEDDEDAAPFLVDGLCEADAEKARAAEVVSRYLVMIRGGAPFLSAADGKLLLTWLDRGLSVPIILAGVDKVAERRRKSKRVRRTLSLSACKDDLKQANAAALPAPPTPTPTPAASLLSLLPPEAGHPAALAALRHAFAAADASPASAEERALLAIDALRQFHERTFTDDPAAASLARAEAAAELSFLDGAVEPRTLQGLVEEAARDRLRRRFPQLSARAVWECLRP